MTITLNIPDLDWYIVALIAWVPISLVIYIKWMRWACAPRQDHDWTPFNEDDPDMFTRFLVTIGLFLAPVISIVVILVFIVGWLIFSASKLLLKR